MRRDIAAEHRGCRHVPGIWPQASEAAAIDPSQVEEFKRFDREQGVPTEYLADGRPQFTSAAHRKKYCRIHGLYDRNAGYSDPEPVNR
jgi:hypothetical protein